MTVTINKWGNSMALRLPKLIVKNLGLEIGKELEIELVDDKIVLKPKKEKMTLEWMCEGMNADDMHQEHFSDTVGRENVWEEE